jgi:hypothetical protein
MVRVTPRRRRVTRGVVQVTRPETQVTRDEVRVTRGEVQVTRDEVRVTRAAIQLTRDEVRVTRAAIQLTRDEVRVARVEVYVTRDEVRVARAEVCVAHAATRVTRDEVCVAHAGARVTRDQVCVVRDVEQDSTEAPRVLRVGVVITGTRRQRAGARLACIVGVYVAACMAACGARTDLSFDTSGVTTARGAGDAGSPVASRDAGETTQPPEDAARHDAAPDGDSGPACTSPCVLGSARCEGGGISTCIAPPDGCTAWGGPVGCGANQTCDTGGTAACACNPGYTLSGGGTCVITAASIAPPRPVAPLSTATVTSHTPTLRWELANGADGALVDLCRDRACTTPGASFQASGSSARPPGALAPGVYYWRLHGTENGTVGTATSPVWELFVGVENAPVATSSGTTLDLNGDGFADVGVGTFGGVVYFYLGGPGGLSTEPTSLPGPPGDDPSFGSAVASAGDVNGDGFTDLIVGAPTVENDAGAAYVFLGGADGVSTYAMMLPRPAGAGGFGTSVSSAGDVNGDGYADVIVGTYGISAQAGDTAFVYLGSAGGPTGTPTMLALPGGVVSSAGDVNGDGFGDVIVGTRAGTAATLYFGSAGGISAMPPPLPRPAGADVTFGNSVASAGDVNGDGYSDVIVGAEAAGVAYVYLGFAGGLLPSPTALTGPPHPMPFTLFGEFVAGVGDVNGDGFADVAVASLEMSSFYVFLGSAAGTTTTAIAVSDGAIGFSAVAGAGDVDGDGFADVVLGSIDASAAYVNYGAAGGVSPSVTVLAPPVIGVEFGVGVARAGPLGRDRAKPARFGPPWGCQGMVRRRSTPA